MCMYSLVIPSSQIIYVDKKDIDDITHQKCVSWISYKFIPMMLHAITLIFAFLRGDAIVYLMFQLCIEIYDIR